MPTNLLVFDHMLVIDSYKALYKELIQKHNIDILAICPTYTIINFQNNSKIFSTIKNDERNWILNLSPVIPINPHRIFYNPLNLLKILRKKRWDAIYIVGEPEWFISAEVIILSKLSRKNVKIMVQTSRNIDFTISKFPYRFSNITRKIDFYVRRNCNALVCIGESTKESFNKSPFSFNHNKLYIHPWHIDVDFFKNRMHNKPNIKLTLGFVGRIEDEKGIINFYEAIKFIKEKVRIIIAGNGSKSEWLNLKIKDLGIEYKFIKDAKMENMPDIYSEIDILIVPSLTTNIWKEQFGRVIPEALSCETAVIGSDSGEIPYVIGDAGLVFKEGNTNDMLEKINYLLDNPEKLIELKRKGRERVIQKFSTVAVANNFVEILKDVIKGD